MSDNVAILGMGMTKIDGAKRGQKLDDMVFEAAYKALQDAGLSRQDIDSVVIAACDELDGRSISSMLLATPAGSYLKDEIKVTDDGSYAVILAAMRILSGQFDLSLVVSWCKTSEAPVSDVMRMRWDPFYHRGFGMNHISTAALMAGAYLKKYGISTDIPAKVVVKNRKAGSKNDKAHLQNPVTLKEVQSSPVVSWPLRSLDCAPESDGACAFVLSSARKARELGRKPVWLKGYGWAVDSYYLGERDLWKSVSLEIAAGKAYEMAGIQNPLKEIDVAEISDFSSYHELLAYEGLGFCRLGKAADLIRDGLTDMKGKLPVNPSGGLISANPYAAAGLFRVAEAYLQVLGKAGDHQIQNVKTAMAQGSTGFCAQGNSVFVLSQ
jgi:acetyl-CoA C-acetyltransferase